MIIIPGYENFAKIELLKKRHDDSKFYVETNEGKLFLLHTSDVKEYEHIKAEFDMMKRVSSTNIRMQQPVDFGLCDDGKRCFQLLTWCDGKEAANIIPKLREAEQFNMGEQAGMILQKIHTIHALESQKEWSACFKGAVDIRFKECHDRNLHFDDDKRIFEYFEANLDIVKNRPQCLRHNDFQLGNMIINNDTLIVIDFTNYDFGDPYEEFVHVTRTALNTPLFSVGVIKGYFGGDPPKEFWKLLAYYTICFLPEYIWWGAIFGQDEIDDRVAKARFIFETYTDKQNLVPGWYQNNI